MKEKISRSLKKIYGILIFVSFFAALLPLFAFLIAIIIGGDIGEKIALFLQNSYYPVVIVMASIAIVVGLIYMYISGEQGLSVKTIGKK